MKPGRYAAIDIGTVTCRLLVADVDSEGRLSEIAKEREFVNLGEGVDATGIISKRAMHRAAAAIDLFLNRINELTYESMPLSGLSVMATSASRDAKNADEFAQMLACRGLEMDVIPGNMEATLSFMGATAELVGKVSSEVMVVDSGGGSTEVAIGIAGNQPTKAHSFNVGCRRVTEKFMSEYPPAPSAVKAAREWIREQLNQWPILATSHGAPTNYIPILAVAGTATSAVTIRDCMTVYDPAKVSGQRVTISDLHEILNRLLKLTLPELESVAGLEPRRAPVISAGMLILDELLHAANADHFTVSESDILEGMIMYNSMKLE